MDSIIPRKERPLSAASLIAARLAAINAASKIGSAAFINGVGPTLDGLHMIQDELGAARESATNLIDRVVQLQIDIDQAIDNYRPQDYNGDTDNGEG